MLVSRSPMLVPVISVDNLVRRCRTVVVGAFCDTSRPPLGYGDQETTRLFRGLVSLELRITVEEQFVPFVTRSLL